MAVCLYSLNSVMLSDAKATSTTIPSREQLKFYLSLAESQQEKELISYTFCRAANLSGTKARSYGLENVF